MKTACYPPTRKSAFTLVDLCTVLAILVVLACMMLSAVAAPKSRSAALGCLSNLRQLQIAWSMYLHDNNDVMLPNGPLNFASQNEIWCPSGESWGLDSGNTNIGAYSNALIGPYISVNHWYLKCPGDVVPSANGQRVRSYSMNSQMGVFYMAKVGVPNYDAPYRQYTNGSDLTCPTPSGAFIFADESPYTLDDGFFQVSTGQAGFPNMPANYLEGGCGISFADGHGEIHQWQTSALLMIPVAYNVTSGGSFNSVQITNADWLWFSVRTACHQ